MTETTLMPLVPLSNSYFSNSYLDELVEQAGDEERLLQLLVEVTSCKDKRPISR